MRVVVAAARALPLLVVLNALTLVWLAHVCFFWRVGKATLIPHASTLRSSDEGRSM